MKKRENIVLMLARRRKSIREYRRGGDIPIEKILTAIEAALEAPSGRNCQPWRFIIIRDKGLKRRIREACEEAEKPFHQRVKGEFKKWLQDRGITWRKPFLEDAPILIAVYSDTECPYPSQSTWIAIAYLILAIEAEGLASLTYTPSKTSKVNEILGVPNRYRLETIIPVGYPSGEKKKEHRAGLEERVFIDRWGNRLDITVK